ncbi:MAG: peptidoglycan DD-metalloendopeptidase family protein, partial [Clostridia bacterium]|nr:peptidoglycan DD-metalloendopeptidase family protein [Clostridia bacterium]
AMAVCLPYNSLRPEAAKKITEADIQALKDKIAANENKIKDAEKELLSLGDDIEKYLQIKAVLDQQINSIESNLEDTTALIGKYAVLIADAEQRIAEREDAISVKYDSFLERLRLSYEDGTKNYLELIVSSENLIEFITRADHLGSVLSYEQTLLNELDREVSDLNAMKDALSLKKAEYEELGNYQNATEAELRDKLKEAEDNLKKLQKDEAALKKVQEQAKKNDAALDQELKDLIKEYEKQQLAASKEKLLWPLPPEKLKVSSKFGSRILFGKYDFHLGIDLPAPYGTDIYASNPGTVLKARYSDSYGYYILIDHGGEVSTLYAHCSKLLVKQGDTVERGQIIAKVGSTGNSSGYHLHFEVRKNGEVTNPLDTKAKWLVVEYKGKMVDPVSAGILKYS